MLMSMMKYVVVFILGVIGYVTYPMLFSEEKGWLKELVYTSDADKKDETKATVIHNDPVVADPVVVSKPAKKADSNNFSVDQIIAADYPKSLTIAKPLKAMTKSGETLKLAAGDKVIPILLNNNKLTVKMKGDKEVTILVAKTNFLELAQARAIKRLGLSENSTANVKVDKVKDKRDKKSDNAKEDSMEDDAPKTEIAKSNNVLSDADVKELVTNGFKTLKTLKGSTVRTVKVVDNESIADEDYQVGEVFFEKETLIGKRRLTAKALIANGSVVKWVWLNSNQEIK